MVHLSQGDLPGWDAIQRLQREPQAAGGHRPHHRRIRQAEQGRGAELLRAVPFPRRKDAVVFRPRHPPVLSLLRLRRLRRRLHFVQKIENIYLPRGRPAGGAEARRAACPRSVRQSRRGPRGQAARACCSICTRPPASFFRSSLRRPEGRHRPRISRRTAASTTRPSPASASASRRSPVSCCATRSRAMADEELLRESRAVFVEGKLSAVSRQPSAKQASLRSERRTADSGRASSKPISQASRS